MNIYKYIYMYLFFNVKKAQLEVEIALDDKTRGGDRNVPLNIFKDNDLIDLIEPARRG